MTVQNDSKSIATGGESAPTVRLPVGAVNPLTGNSLNVNFCKNPVCANFGIPARIELAGSRMTDKDARYHFTSSYKSRPNLSCKGCGRWTLVKNNASIQQEIDRLTSAGVGAILDHSYCPDVNCRNHGVSCLTHPKEYIKKGFTAARSQLLKCKQCGGEFTLSGKKKTQYGYTRQPDLPAKIAGAFVCKVPMRKTLKLLGLGKQGAQRYYRNLRHFAARARRFNAAFDRLMMNGGVSIANVNVQTDGQEHVVNWSDRKDRRNTLVRTACSVAGESGYILQFSAAYDERADIIAMAKHTEQSGQLGGHECFRDFAQYWLPGDEYQGHRAAGRKSAPGGKGDLLRHVRQAYEDALLSREEEDNIGKTPAVGAMIHFPYTVHAHFAIVEKMLSRCAGHVTHYLDHEFQLRAACLAAFQNRVAGGTCDAFFVSTNKSYTIDERRAIAARVKAAFQKNCREALRDKKLSAVVRDKLTENIRNAAACGEWGDKWVKHPMPQMNEPEKAMCFLTGGGKRVDESLVRKFLASGLSDVDRAFMRLRRDTSFLERPLARTTGNNEVWHLYQFYKPAHVQIALDIFRADYNFCATGEDEKTPAQRLGLTDRVWTLEEIYGHENSGDIAEVIARGAPDDSAG